MTLAIVLLPTSQGAALFSTKHGLKHALERQGYKVKTFHPLSDSLMAGHEIEKLFRQNRANDFFDSLLNNYDKKKCQDADIVLIDGIRIQKDATHKFSWLNAFISEFNSNLIYAFSAKTILIACHGNKSLDELQIQLQFYLQHMPGNYLGAIITKVNAPVDECGNNRFSLLDETESSSQLTLSFNDINNLAIFKYQALDLLGVTFWQDKLAYPRAKDIASELMLSTLNHDYDQNRRIELVTMCSRTVDHIFPELKAGTLIITAADRSDIILASALAAQNGVKLSGLILTAYRLGNRLVIDFCIDIANKTKLPLFATHNKSISTILKLTNFDYSRIAKDDHQRLDLLESSIAECVDIGKIEACLNKATQINKNMSPPAFRHYLVKRASESIQRIILPEGQEPRTIEAAIICTQKHMAHCILLGKPENVRRVAKNHGLSLPSDLTLLDPDTIKANYIAPLVACRKNKGMTEILAKDALEDNVTLGTMMLQCGDVDGLVAGALNTTAHTISPALKIIKTKPQCSIVSSVFFMCMKDQVLVYGDCAVNPDPTAEQLAQIAIQSAHSAKTFGIKAKIAMISYSTGESGHGVDVEKVKQATAIVKAKYPDLFIDGPLQYDAATNPSVAKKKAPHSQVAGSATVFIFPDLNTGNTTYKAVQRSANVLSIGPILQGLNKPVNDLSRGASIDDIIYTIAITAIQAQS